MSWRVARSLDVLLDEINTAAPLRNKASDGSIGDAAHATRDSDHNPWVVVGGQGIVRARDFTHDPDGGLDCWEVANRLAAHVAAGSHPAARSGAYVIWQRRILSFDRRHEGWRTYSGSNPHEHHLHLSVATDPGGFDSTQPWGVMSTPQPEEADDMALSDKLYPNRSDSPTVRDALRAVLRFEAAEKRRAESLRKAVAAVRTAVDGNADKAEIRSMLNNLDATIQIVVADPEEKP